ncbi:membrane fusion protein (multidrug efflux system) [Yoonia maritima]|uniref:Membrane fusion protein (Multidrug efflux system) n=1 Tax=Yoonia maritima TaxID=1435347 RepID=A0A2T0VVH1_9RHOB|nr:efflux RND transporter periplasmic adaptor subunit [Yoonia maritima]PRY75499.1 membrane fusion protein (multidrug efflux system) [Yoonia maritima]
MKSTDLNSLQGTSVRLLTLLLLLFSAPVHAQGMPPGGPAQGPTQVGTITLSSEDVPYVRTLPGRAVSFEETDLRPRVSGLIEAILYTPGAPLKVGDPMFKIEDASYRAAVASAEAALASAQVDATTSTASLDRYRSLQNSSAVTQADLQAAEATAAASEAGVAAAQAALDIAILDLSHTTVVSPIDGIGGLPEVSVGALVTANQADPLGSVTRLDPIYIDVSDSSAARLRVRDRIQTGNLTVGDKLEISLTLEDGSVYLGEGSLITPGTTVSTTTGTFDLRVQFDNPDRLIMPGQFLRVDITFGTTKAALVPQRATSRASNGALTAFVVREGNAQQVTLSSSGSYDNSWVVTEGADVGDVLIVDGLSNLVDGAEVTTVPVTINADGAVIDTPSDTDDTNGKQ